MHTMFYQFGMDPIFADEELLEKLNTNQITYAEIPENEKHAGVV